MTRPKSKQGRAGGGQLDMRSFSKPSANPPQQSSPDRYRNQRPMTFVRSEYQSGYFYQPGGDDTVSVAETEDAMAPLHDTLSRLPGLMRMVQKYGPHIADGVFHGLSILPVLIAYVYGLSLAGLQIKYSFLIAAFISSTMTMIVARFSTNALYVTYHLPLTLYCIVLLQRQLGYRLNDILLFTTASSLILAIILFTGSIKWWHKRLPRAFRAGVSIGSNIYLISIAFTIILHYTNGSVTESSAKSLNDPNYLGQLSQSLQKIDIRAQISSVVIFVCAALCYILSFILNSRHVEESVEHRDSMATITGPYQASEGENAHLYNDPEKQKQEEAREAANLEHRSATQRAMYYLRQYQVAPILVAFCALFYITIVGLVWPLQHSALEALSINRTTVTSFYFRYWTSIGDFFNVFTLFNGSLGARWGTFVSITLNLFLVWVLALFQIIDFINACELLAHYKHINRDLIASVHYRNAESIEHAHHHYSGEKHFHPHNGDCQFGIGCHRPGCEVGQDQPGKDKDGKKNKDDKKSKDDKKKNKDGEKVKDKKDEEKAGKKNKDKKGKGKEQKDKKTKDSLSLYTPAAGPNDTNPVDDSNRREEEDEFKDVALGASCKDIHEIAGSPVSGLLSPLSVNQLTRPPSVSLSPTLLYNTDHDPVPVTLPRHGDVSAQPSNAESVLVNVPTMSEQQEAHSLSALGQPSHFDSSRQQQQQQQQQPTLKAHLELTVSGAESNEKLRVHSENPSPVDPLISSSLGYCLSDTQPTSGLVSYQLAKDDDQHAQFISPSGFVRPKNQNDEYVGSDHQINIRSFKLPPCPCLCDDPSYSVPDPSGPFPFTKDDEKAIGIVSSALVITSLFSFFGLTFRPFPYHMLTTSTWRSVHGIPRNADDDTDVDIYHGVDINELNQGAKSSAQIGAFFIMLIAVLFSKNITELFMVPVVIAFFLFAIGFDAVRVTLQQYWHYQKHSSFYRKHADTIEDIKITDGNEHTLSRKPEGPLAPIQEHSLQAKSPRPDHITIQTDSAYPAHFFLSTLLCSVTLLLCSLGLISQAIFAGTLFIICQGVTSGGISLIACIKDRLISSHSDYEPIPSSPED